jgi:thiosulfate reductase cytochrome b subunit
MFFEKTPDLNEILRKEIDLIQDVIKRMANNSFLLKGWLVSIIVIVLALHKDSVIGQNSQYWTYLVLILPVFSFWYLDAYYLRQERLYRKLYSWVIGHRTNSREYTYDLNTSRFDNEVPAIRKIMFSITLRIFYGVPILLITGLIIYKAINDYLLDFWNCI